jgi:hypothetical protein
VTGRVRRDCPGVGAELERVGAAVFGSLRRSDQRRWAGVYVRGLLAGTGRPSARRLAQGVPVGRADQALQQFVGHSPWDPGPVRRALAGAAEELFRPAAWVAVEVVFTKDGRLSPGVDRQYVRRLGRVANCQVGMAIVLADAHRALPVQWALMLPPAWDADPARRARARVPDHEVNRPAWRHALDATDTVAGWPGVAPAPLVCESATAPAALALGAELGERRQEYATEVPGALPVRPPGAERPRPLAELVVRTGRRRTVLLTGPSGRPSRSQYVVLPVEAAGRPRGPGGDPIGAERLVALAEWPHSAPEPRCFWVTNLTERPVEDLVALIRMRDVAARAVGEMLDGCGLGGYEGRSHPGWHHHVTLASVAYAVALAHEARCTEGPCAQGRR